MTSSYRCRWCRKNFEAKRKALYCSDVCRSRAWKAKHPNHAENAREPVPAMKSKPSGITQAHFKTVRGVAAFLGIPESLAGAAVREGLSDRMRQILHERNHA